MEAAHGVNAPGTRVRVLFILDEFPGPHAGTESQVWLLFQGLDRRAFDPAILLLRPSRWLREHAREARVTVLGVPRLASIRGITRIVRAAFQARRNGYHVAHIFFNDSAIVFPVWLKVAGIRVVVARRDLGFWYTRANLMILRWQVRFVDRVIANCEAVRKSVLRAEGFRAEQSVTIYNGYARAAPAAVAVRETFGVPSGARLIVVVANLRPLKRIADVIAALPRLTAEVEETHLLVVGEDREGERGPSHRSELNAAAASLAILERVHFAGRIADPMPIIALADVCVLASETEGLSNVIIEYMFAGKPVVATRVGGNDELIVDGETGLLTPAGDTDALARALGTILAEPERAAAFGRAGRERAMRLFSAQSMIDQHQGLYRGLSEVKSAASAK